MSALLCRWVSLLGATMSAAYSTIAFGASAAAVTWQHPNHGLRDESRASLVFGAFNSLGTVMFAFGGHAILLEVQAWYLTQCPLADPLKCCDAQCPA